MSEAGGGRAPRNYEWWAQAILDWFLPKVGPEETATLSVDRESLAEATGDRDAAAELGRAVRSRLGPGGHSFGPVLRATRTWERSRLPGPHPALPLLALTVVAAADMGEIRAFHGNDFYRPLRLLLDPSDDGEGAPGDFPDVIDDLWASLDRWLDGDLRGERGRSSFKPPPHPRHIGYSLAQAAVRGPDRRHLRRFLAMALEDDQLSVEELRVPLAEWARRLGPAGRRLARLAQSPRLEGICTAVLRQEIDQVLGRRRAGRAQVHVLMDLRPLRLQLVSSRPQGYPAVLRWGDGQGGRHQVEALTEDWYEALPLGRAQVLEALRSGLRVGDPPHVAELEPAPVVALARDQTFGEWLSVSRLRYGEMHALLVAEEQLEAIEKFLAAEGAGARVRPQLTSALPGWALVEFVRLDRRPMTEAPPELARLLGAGGGPTARLVGGLRVPPLRHRYLTGGEPLVRVPWSSGSGERVEIEHEGQVLRLQPTAQGESQAELPLQGLGLLPGHYTVRVGGRAIAFELVDALVEALPRRLCEVTSCAGSDEICGYLPVSGTWERPRPLTWPARPHAEVIALGARDDQFLLVPDPAWLDELAGGLAWDVREVEAAFPIAWIVVADGQSEPVASPLQALEPLPSGNAVARWRSTIQQARPADACSASDRLRFARYKAVARRRA